LTRARKADEKIIKKLFEVKSPEQLGILSQAKHEKRGVSQVESWTGIQIEDMWQIRQEQQRTAYEKLLENERHLAIPSIRTAEANEEAKKEMRSQHDLFEAAYDLKDQETKWSDLDVGLREREQLLLHGSGLENMRGIVCQGFKAPRKTGAFGKGLYFADRVEKSDQYNSACVTNETQLTSTGSNGRLEDSCLKWVLVVRANMGKTVQLQQEVPCTSDSAKRKSLKISHWLDPGVQKDEIVWELKSRSDDDEGNFTGAPPYENWDSVQVIATSHNESFSRPWAKICNYTNRSNTLPWRFNEYVMKPTVPQPRLVAEYLVSYRRYLS